MAVADGWFSFFFRGIVIHIDEVDRKVGPSHGRPRTDVRTDGRTGGDSRPPRTPPIASAFGDTDGEFCGRILRPNVASTTVDAEVFFLKIISKNLPGG